MSEENESAERLRRAVETVNRRDYVEVVRPCADGFNAFMGGEVREEAPRKRHNGLSIRVQTPSSRR